MWSLAKSAPRGPESKGPPARRPHSGLRPPEPASAGISFVPGPEAPDPAPPAPGSELRRLRGRRPDGPRSAARRVEIEAPRRSAPAAACGRRAPSPAARGPQGPPASGSRRWLAAAPTEIGAAAPGVALTAPAVAWKRASASEGGDGRGRGAWAWARAHLKRLRALHDEQPGTCQRAQRPSDAAAVTRRLARAGEAVVVGGCWRARTSPATALLGTAASAASPRRPPVQRRQQRMPPDSRAPPRRSICSDGKV